MFVFFSVQPLCSLCHRGGSFDDGNPPQRHREHGGRTENDPQSGFLMWAVAQEQSTAL